VSLFLLAVTCPPRLNRRSTGALDGRAVLVQKYLLDYRVAVERRYFSGRVSQIHVHLRRYADTGWCRLLKVKEAVFRD